MRFQLSINSVCDLVDLLKPKILSCPEIGINNSVKKRKNTQKYLLQNINLNKAKIYKAFDYITLSLRFFVLVFAKVKENSEPIPNSLST